MASPSDFSTRKVTSPGPAPPLLVAPAALPAAPPPPAAPAAAAAAAAAKLTSVMRSTPQSAKAGTKEGHGGAGVRVSSGRQQGAAWMLSTATGPAHSVPTANRKQATLPKAPRGLGWTCTCVACAVAPRHHHLCHQPKRAAAGAEDRGRANQVACVEDKRGEVGGSEGAGSSREAGGQRREGAR